VLVLVAWLVIRALIRAVFPKVRSQTTGAVTSVPTGTAAGGVAVAVTGAATVATASLLAASDEIDGMNEGDYHNGPAGYSPMTAYPETQYGSGFDEDAEWHEEQ
jgi:hypothetical protein